MNFKRLNNIFGWFVFAIASFVYVYTSEAGGSFWDCGEFVSSCFKLEVPHPPGAPLFILMGRVATLFVGANPLLAAKAVNVMNAFGSSFAILFLFWTITYFARRIMKVRITDVLTSSQAISIIGAGAVGALAYTFTDSFWYSAVEGEVYSLSSFFTAIVFWTALKWEQHCDEPQGDRWLVLLFFLIGLSVGVHLLSLLVIPAVVMMYYTHKHNLFNYKLLRKWFRIITIAGGFIAIIATLVGANAELNPDRGLTQPDHTLTMFMIFATIMTIVILWLVEKIDTNRKAYFGGMYIFFIIGCVITGIVQVAVIQYTVAAAGYFDRIFVNDLGMPFFVGFGFFFVVTALLIRFLLKYATKKRWAYLRLAVWCFAFLLIGYSTYVTTMIRSNANPPIDMYKVDNPITLVGYLGRDQYGDFPILYGQNFTARPSDYKETDEQYEKRKNRYIPIGKKGRYVYAPEDKMLFPRVWDRSNEQNHAYYYSSFLGIQRLQDNQSGEQYDRTPNQLDNLKFFTGYQVYWMYLRYFLWNFAGKQNDIQGFYHGNVRDGNWLTGTFIDRLIFGNQSAMPDTLNENKAHNKLYGLPLILGLIGLFFHFKRKSSDGIVVLLLFFFTGIAIMIYLNAAGYQPRERDYAFVGSFYAFAVWIGLGVLFVIEKLKRFIPNQKTAALSATLLCLLAVPTIMATQEWDDHDRHKKELPRDLAKAYLESCAPNAILFTFGDNDTYPLWYAQEVEGIRPDIRIMNTSLLGTDWYINSLRRKINKSDTWDIIFDEDQIVGHKRDYITYNQIPGVDPNKYYDMYEVLKDVVGNDKYMDQTRGGEEGINIFPTKKFYIPIDKNLVKQNRTVNPDDIVIDSLKFDFPRDILLKNELAMLAVIATNKWQRPIYFTDNRQAGLGLESFMRRDGMSYRLVPVSNSRINGDLTTRLLLDKSKFNFGNANIKGVYFDEENRRHLLSFRVAYAELASYLADHNKKEEARRVLARIDEGINQSNFPYGLLSPSNHNNSVSFRLLQACYAADDSVLAAKISGALKKDFQQQLRYYATLGGMSSDRLKTIVATYTMDRRQAEASYQMAQTQAEQQAAAQKANEAENTFNDALNDTQKTMAEEIKNTFNWIQQLENEINQYQKLPFIVPTAVRTK